MPICANCDWWCKAKILSRGDKGTVTYRKCPALKMRVQSQDKSCKYFNPVYFHCDKNNCRLTFGQCLARRRNPKNLIGYQNCKNCRQFDREIREIVEEYYIDMVPIVTPRHLARGNEMENVEENNIGSGKIKRRNKKEGNNPNGKRKIKRRENPPPNGKRRKIKRRSKPKASNNNGLAYTVCPKCGQEGMRDEYCRVCAFKVTDKPKRKIKRRSK
jgi:hypothetical protein